MPTSTCWSTAHGATRCSSPRPSASSTAAHRAGSTTCTCRPRSRRRSPNGWRACPRAVGRCSASRPRSAATSTSPRSRPPPITTSRPHSACSRRPSSRRSWKSAASAGSRSGTRCSALPCTTSSARQAGPRPTPASPRSSKRTAAEPVRARPSPRPERLAGERGSRGALRGGGGRRGDGPAWPTRPRRSTTARPSSWPRTPSTASRCCCGGPTPTPRRAATPPRGPGTRRPPSWPRVVRRTWPRPRSGAAAARDGGRPGRAVAHAAAPGARRGRRPHPALRARLLARLSIVVAASASPEQRAGLVAEAAALAAAAADPLALADVGRGALPPARGSGRGGPAPR